MQSYQGLEKIVIQKATSLAWLHKYPEKLLNLSICTLNIKCRSNLTHVPECKQPCERRLRLLSRQKVLPEKKHEKRKMYQYNTTNTDPQIWQAALYGKYVNIRRISWPKKITRASFKSDSRMNLLPNLPEPKAQKQRNNH